MHQLLSFHFQMVSTSPAMKLWPQEKLLPRPATQWTKQYLKCLEKYATATGLVFITVLISPQDRDTVQEIQLEYCQIAFCMIDFHAQQLNFPALGMLTPPSFSGTDLRTKAPNYSQLESRALPSAPLLIQALLKKGLKIHLNFNHSSILVFIHVAMEGRVPWAEAGYSAGFAHGRPAAMAHDLMGNKSLASLKIGLLCLIHSGPTHHLFL